MVEAELMGGQIFGWYLLDGAWRCSRGSWWRIPKSEVVVSGCIVNMLYENFREVRRDEMMMKQCISIHPRTEEAGGWRWCIALLVTAEMTDLLTCRELYETLYDRNTDDIYDSRSIGLEYPVAVAQYLPLSQRSPVVPFLGRLSKINKDLLLHLAGLTLLTTWLLIHFPTVYG